MEISKHENLELKDQGITPHLDWMKTDEYLIRTIGQWEWL